MPGGIDPHVHLDMPFMGTYSSDNYETGTRAALFGGTTTVIDFILQNKAIVYKLHYKNGKEEAIIIVLVIIAFTWQ
jgi:dihydroorotase-like cyclic amidohydrolase